MMKKLLKTIRKLILESYSGTVYGRPLPKDMEDESLWHQFKDWLYGDDRADGKLSVSAKYNKRSPSLKKVIDALNAARHDTDRKDLIDFLNDINMQYVRGKGKVLFESREEREQEKLQMEKLTKLLTGDGNPDLESVRQAIEIGESLGWIEVIETESRIMGMYQYFHLWFSEEFYNVVRYSLYDMEDNMNYCEVSNRFGTVKFEIRDHSYKSIR